METLIGKQEAIEKLYSKIKDVQVCMLSTLEENGELRSRPMATISTEPNGTLWFFTKEFSQKVDEIENFHNVNLSYAEPKGNVYVSISGRAYVSKDRAKMEQLWNGLFRAWFPQGLEDPDIALLKVEMVEAEYWEASANKMVQLFGMVKAIVTGKEFSPGEHEKISI